MDISKKIFTGKRLLIVASIALLGIFTMKFTSNDKNTSGNTTVGSRELPIYCVNTEEKKIALTFDAAWGNEDTGTILDILAKHEIKATFFVTGGWVDKYPEDLKKIADAGHIIGNHSQNHKYMSKLSTEGIKDELKQVKDKADAITGQSMNLFRPPYGDYNNALITTAKEEGYYTIQWDVDTLVI